ncbi:uncharacterized protein [Heterodontus francisci]|uniref:uncharacterized protein n=1 Tax=Heterodontus francisci TaxID=7792 RepID=UPI00355C9CF3
MKGNRPKTLTLLLSPQMRPDLLSIFRTFVFITNIIVFGTELFREEPLRYRVYQPLPWQVQNVSRNRRSSRVDEKDGGSRRSSVNSSKGNRAKGMPHSLSEEENSFTESNPERAAVTIQTQYRRYQQRKNYERNP